MTQVANPPAPRSTAATPDSRSRPGSRQRVVRALENCMYWTGAATACRWLGGSGGALVLMYHSIAPDQQQAWIDPRNRLAPAEFERQMEFLAHRRHVVSLNDLVGALEQGRDLESGSVVITFDDGYRDNLEVALPILEKYKLPATVFLATGYVNRAQPQWIDRLYSAFAFRTQNELEVGDATGKLRLSGPDAALRAYRRVAERLLAANWDQRQALLEQVEAQLAASSHPPALTLTWDQVREMTARFPLLELGAHTRDHIDLRAHTGTVAEHDLQGCIADIERETGRRPAHFSFPYGRYAERTLQMVRNLGFRSAMVGEATAIVRAGTNPFRIPRLEAPDSLTQLAYWTSGAAPGLLGALAR